MPESLGQRLFKRRLELIAGLDRDSQVGEPERALRSDTADLLHRIVAGMHVDSVLVRPHRRWVETYSSGKPGRASTHRPQRNRRAPLEPAQQRTRRGRGCQAIRPAELRAQLCVLNAEPGFVRLRDQVREIAGALLTRTSIPAIAARAELLEELATEQWWTNVTLPMLEHARLRVRGLVHLIERAKRKVVYTECSVAGGGRSVGPVKILAWCE